MHNIELPTLKALVDTFADRGDAIAILDFGNRSGDDSMPEAITYRQLHESIVALAGGLRERGIGAGDMVWLCAPNSPGWISAYFATVCAGAAAVPLDDQASRDMQMAVLRHSEAGFAFTSARHVEELAETDTPLTDY